MKTRKITRIIVHCTDSPDSRDSVDAAEIDRWHKQRGWEGIGYHYVVKRDGSIEAGRPEEKIGAHCVGHNFDSIGVVWVGKDKQSDAQKKSFKAIVQGLMAKYKLKPGNVFGHCEFEKGKTCPNLDMKQFRSSL